MISIVCVYNNEKTFRNVLLSGLQRQTVPYELIALDNRDRRFSSAAQALNYGGDKATGDYIAFVHQDMWFADEAWLENAETFLESIPDLGVAGVAGMSDAGEGWLRDARRSISLLGDSPVPPLATKIEEVQTLDECVLIVARDLFDQGKFDEEVFDGWDCYGADYCLAVLRKGKKNYVIPGDCHHCCLRESNRLPEFRKLHEYQGRLYEKYRREFPKIHTWMGEVSWRTLKLNALLNFLYPLYIRVFPKWDDLLEDALAGCESVLDLGCGYFSPINTLNIPHTVGVDISRSNIEESTRRDVHDEALLADVRELDYPDDAFDAVIALNLLEYMPKKDGQELAAKMQRWAKKQVLVKTMNMPVLIDDESVAKTVSAWKTSELEALGLEVRGLGGWRKLYPRKNRLARLLSVLTQKLVFRLPSQAMELFACQPADTGHRSGVAE